MKKENRILSVLIYLIVIITAVMTLPLVFRFAGDYANIRRPLTQGDGDSALDRSRTARNRRYSAGEAAVIDISWLAETEYGALELITAKALNGGCVILFCSEPAGNNSQGQAMRIAVVRNAGAAGEQTAGADPDHASASASISFSVSRAVRHGFAESVRNKDYVFKDYGDGTVFMSNNNYAFLFDAGTMRIIEQYQYPQGYKIYQTALSNSKNMIAIASEQGFFVADLTSPSFLHSSALSPSNMKEIISARNDVSGAALTARLPVWSDDDEYIFYRLYADETVRNAGMTAPSPGGNEQLASLESANFIFLGGGNIFYYFSQGAGTGTGDLFRCGFFNINEKRMTDVMRSQVHYFNIDVSSSGSLLAALSRNGNLIRMSVIDIHTKRRVYSSLYSEIYDFSFSPDEKNFIIYAEEGGIKTLKVINIDWTEE
jgi:hypothetical protein